MLRRATIDDARAIAELHRTTTLHAYAHIFPPEAPKPSVDDLLPTWTDRLLRSSASTAAPDVAPTVVFVITDGSSAGCIGVAALEAPPAAAPDGRAGAVRLLSFYVRPDQWDRGWGRALHEAVVADAEARRAQSIDVLVLEGNERGRAWYLRHGYRPTGIRVAAFPDVPLHDEGLRLDSPFLPTHSRR